MSTAGEFSTGQLIAGTGRAIRTERRSAQYGIRCSSTDSVETHLPAMGWWLFWFASWLRRLWRG